MASEYLRKLAQEQPPPEKPRELTPSEKRRNWLHYHKIWLIIGAVLLVSAGSILWNALEIGRTKPDYIFAWADTAAPDRATVRALEEGLARFGSDRNGDGRVAVELRLYTSTPSADAESAWYYGVASNTRLMADITRGESCFFLSRRPEVLQQAYCLLADGDGSRPAEGDFSVDGKVYAWTDCPALTGLAPDPDSMAGVFLGRRWFPDGGVGREADDLLWKAITEGANR